METDTVQRSPEQEGAKRVLLAIDTWLPRLAKWFSYFGGVAIIAMAFIGTANIIASKAFGNAIANTNELIDYGLIIVVYCAVADVQFGMGLLRVDIFTRKFPPKLDRAIQLIGHVLGTVIYAFAGYEAISLLRDHMRLVTKAAASVHSFVIWPFTMVYVVGTFFLAFALLWSIVRMVALPAPVHAPVETIATDVVSEVAE